MTDDRFSNDSRGRLIHNTDSVPTAEGGCPTTPEAPASSMPPQPHCAPAAARRPFWRSEWFWLGVVLVVAAALRAWYLAEVAQAPDFRALRQDLDVQDYQARAMVSGDWTVPEGRNDPEITTTPYYRPPGYPYLLAGIYFITRGSYLAPRVFNMLLGLLSIVLMWLFGRAVYGRWVGMATAALMAGYWGFLYYEGEVNDPAMFVVLIPCLLWSLRLWATSYKFHWALLAGLLTGVYAIMRPNILLFGPFMAAWMLHAAWQAGRLRYEGMPNAAGQAGWEGMTPPGPPGPPPRRGDQDGLPGPSGTLPRGDQDDTPGSPGHPPSPKGYGGTQPLSTGDQDVRRGVRVLARRVAGGWIGLFAAFLIIAPVTVRNYVVSGEFVPVSTYFGENFLIGNGEDSDGCTSWTPYLQKLEGTGRFSVWEYSNIVHGLGREVGNEKLTNSEASKIFFQKGRDYAMAHKARTLKLAFKKAVLFWSPWEITENKVVQSEKDHYPPLRYMPGFPLFMGLFCAGMLIMARDARRGRLMDGRSPGDPAPGPGQVTTLILLFILVYYASFIPFFVNARARHPIVPLMLLFGGYGLFRIGAWTAARRWLPAVGGALLVAVLAGLAAVDWVPYRPDTARWRYDRADSWLTAGEVDKAAAEAGIMLGLDYSYYMPFRLGHAFAGKGRPELAARLLKAAISPTPEEQPVPYREDLWFHIGAAHAAAGKTAEAKAAFDEALRLNPKDARALNDLGYLLEQAGDAVQAADLYRRALEARADFALARTNLGELLARQGDLAAAVREYEQAAKDAPGSPEIQYNLARHLADAGRADEALTVYRGVVALNPKDVRAWNNLGLLLTQQGDTAGAEKSYRNALEKAPDYALARANLGNLLMDRGRFDEGVAVYEEGLALDPKNADLMNGLGWRYDRKGDADRARSWYDRALETAPAFVTARINRAGLLVQTGRIEDAEKDARIAADQAPKNVQAVFLLGNICAMSGRADEAADHYRRALKLDPAFAAARDNLALVTGTVPASSKTP